jgi:hypothetical protein
MVWQSMVFIGVIILVPILVAIIIGGRGKKEAPEAKQDGKGT